jgi:hypothetical protein
MSQLRSISPVVWVCVFTLPSISSCSKQERNYDTNEGGTAGSSEAGAAGNDVGGKSSTGGKSATGGRAGTGGTVSNGGTSASGGTVSNGGTSASSGTVSNGGTSASGGTVSNGGTTVSIGGNTAVGGTSTRTTAVCQTPADCSDGDPCNGVETCNAGTCALGTPACVNRKMSIKTVTVTLCAQARPGMIATIRNPPCTPLRRKCVMGWIITATEGVISKTVFR